MHKIFAVIFLLFMSISTVLADESEGIIRVKAAIGFTTGLTGDEATYTFDNARGFLHIDVLGINFMDATSGIGIEIGLNSFSNFSSSFWSLNRTTVPKTGNRFYGGTDLKFLQSSNISTDFDFDLRIITGTRFGAIGPGTINIELYFIEENRPIAFAVMYSW